MKFSVAVAMSAPEQYGPLAEAAESLGYHAVVLPDSIFYSEQVSVPYPYTQDGKRMWGAETPFLDPLIAVAHMAARTRRLFFYTSVVKLSVRDPVLMAKQLGSLAALTEDRFGFGVGLGWLPEESRWCGTDHATRAPRFEEQVQILKGLLAGGPFEFHGTYYDIGRIQMSPAPRKPMPIYVGGHELPGLRRAARHGDGWSSAMLPAKKLIEIVERLKALLAEEGRANDPFEIQGVVTDVADADGFRRLEDAGVTDLITMPWALYGHGLGNAPLDKKLDGMKRFADRVMAQMTQN
jgi:probable F420-dependent oxidoreductase